MIGAIFRGFRRYVWPLITAAAVGVAGLVSQCTDQFSRSPSSVPAPAFTTPAPAPKPAAKAKPAAKGKVVKVCYDEKLNLFGNQVCWLEEKK